MKTFLSEFDSDIRENLKQLISVLWTYSSNAIEGSSLTLGGTDFVIREGFTVSGKPDLHEQWLPISARNELILQNGAGKAYQ